MELGELVGVGPVERNFPAGVSPMFGARSAKVSRKSLSAGVAFAAVPSFDQL